MAEAAEGSQTTGAPFRLSVTLRSRHTLVESETNFLPRKGARPLTRYARRAWPLGSVESSGDREAVGPEHRNRPRARRSDPKAWDACLKTVSLDSFGMGVWPHLEAWEASLRGHLERCR